MQILKNIANKKYFILIMLISIKIYPQVFIPFGFFRPIYKDNIYQGLSTSRSSYLSAPNGTWVKITASEYTNVQSTVLLTQKAGSSDSLLASTPAGSNWCGAGVSSAVSLDPAITPTNPSYKGTFIPPMSYIFAIAFRVASASATVLGKASASSLTSGFVNLSSAAIPITGTSGLSYAVLKQAYYLANVSNGYPGMYINDSGSLTFQASSTSNQTYYRCSAATTDSPVSGHPYLHYYQYLTTTFKQW
jgi:hypothetical protein